MDSVRRLLVSLFLLWMAGPVWSAMTIEIVGGAANRIVVAIGPFGQAAAGQEDVARVLTDDLSMSGQFSIVNEPSLLVGDASTPAWGRVRRNNVDAVVVGQVTPLPDANVEVRFRLYDAVRARQMVGFSYVVPLRALRGVAHRIAEEVHLALLGSPGAYGGRITYVVKQAGRYALKVSDVDGHNVSSVLESPEPIISPAWSPDGNQIAYVSFEERRPIVYVQTLSDGKRRAVSRFRGSNSAPAWSPDGKRIVVALTRDQSSQLYQVDALGQGEPVRLMRSSSIDTEPVYSQDGRFIFFTSDRGGSPQIYRFELASGETQRITFDGSYNVSPALSRDGRWLAFVHRVEGAFRIAVMELATRQVQVLTETDYDQAPSFAANDRIILYATRVQGRGVLATVSLDGKIKQRLTQEGDLREPAWSP
ncbi:MAG: Tol-Pal system protein TolB [Betaproteobacteria bacterium]|nr:Tol-Pal system protein TolB [Betaproteobacteria bacterium]